MNRALFVALLLLSMALAALALDGALEVAACATDSECARQCAANDSTCDGGPQS